MIGKIRYVFLMKIYILAVETILLLPLPRPASQGKEGVQEGDERQEANQRKEAKRESPLSGRVVTTGL